MLLGTNFYYLYHMQDFVFEVMDVCLFDLFEHLVVLLRSALPGLVQKILHLTAPCHFFKMGFVTLNLAVRK